MVRFAIVCFMSLLCAACGGGSGAPSSTPAAGAKKILVELYGDSTQWGCTVVTGAPAGSKCETIGYAQTADPVAAQVQTMEQTAHGANVTVVNHGVPGETTTELLAGDQYNLPWAQQMAQSQADIVVFNDGMNDANVGSGETPATYQTNLNSLIQTAKAAGKTVVLETPNPSTDPDRAALPDFVIAARTTAQQWDVTVIDQYAQLTGNPQWDLMLCDGVHPTQAGYDLKATIEFDGLDPVVAFALAH
jgi:acyl-CoA thioesterase I